MTWMLFWKITMVLALGTFAILAVFVTVLGARDIRHLLDALRHLRDDSPDDR